MGSLAQVWGVVLVTRARGSLALAAAAAAVAALRRSPMLFDRVVTRPMAAINDAELLTRPNEVRGAPTRFVANVVESSASAGFVSLHGLPSLLLLLLPAMLGTTSGAATICCALHGRQAASLNSGHGSLLASESRQWQMTLPGCLFDSRPAMTAVGVLGKADARRPMAGPRARVSLEAGSVCRQSAQTEGIYNCGEGGSHPGAGASARSTSAESTSVRAPEPAPARSRRRSHHKRGKVTTIHDWDAECSEAADAATADVSEA